MRGLKLADSLQYTTIRFVAPFAGAWIEISYLYNFLSYQRVAPFAGAWIEINNDYFFINSLSSPLCGCVVSTILNLSNYAIKIV